MVDKKSQQEDATTEENYKEEDPTAGGDFDRKKNCYEDEHTISLAELKEKLETDLESGLTNPKAKDRLEKIGPNSLTPPPKTPKWLKFCTMMFRGFAIVLWFGATLCFVAFGIDYAEGDPSPEKLYTWAVP